MRKYKVSSEAKWAPPSMASRWGKEAGVGKIGKKGGGCHVTAKGCENARSAAAGGSNGVEAVTMSTPAGDAPRRSDLETARACCARRACCTLARRYGASPASESQPP